MTIAPRTWMAVTLGLLAGVVYTLSPVTVLTLAGIPLLMHVAARGLPRREAHTLWWVIVAAVALRGLAILALMLVSDHDSQATAILSGDEAYSLARTRRIRDVLLGLPLLKHDYQIAFEDYGETSYLGLLTVLQVLFGPAPYALRLVNVLVFAAGGLLLFRVVRHAYGREAALLCLSALLVLPTLFLWSISLLKEALYFALCVGVVAAVVAALRAGRAVTRILSAASLGVALWALSDLRSGALSLVGGGALLGVALWVVTASRRRVVLAATLTAAVVGVTAATSVDLGHRVHDALEQTARIHRGHVFTQGHAYKTLDEGFYASPAFSFELALTPGEAARYAIRSLASFVVRPWPWQMETRNERVFLPEHILWYVVLGLVPFGVVAGFKRDRLVTCLLIGIIVPATLVVALTNGNVGTLIRFRGLVWPYMIALSALGACVLVERLTSAAFEVTARKSALIGLLARSRDILSAAWRHSWLAGTGVRAAAAFTNAPLERQLQLAGWTLVTFVAVHYLLVRNLPLTVGPALPHSIWAIAALGGLVLISLSNSLAVAWVARRSR